MSDRWSILQGRLLTERRTVSDRTKIEWTESTWNPVRGCTKVSPGCAHCYAETFSERFRGVSGHAFEQGFDLRLVPEALALPRTWRRGRLVFVNSMSDLFHESVPDDYIRQVFEVMRQTPRHTYQVLTKRAERMAEIAHALAVPKNVWMGVSVESAQWVWRIERLREVPASVRFLSLEPLLGPIEALTLDGIQWVILGGESGPKARPLQVEWVRSIRDQCLAAQVPFFFKQWGGTRKKVTGRRLDRRTWSEWPRAAG